VAGQSLFAGTEELEAIAQARLWEGVRESRRWWWPLQGFAGRAAPSLQCKLLTHSCSTSRSSGGTAGWLAAGKPSGWEDPCASGFRLFQAAAWIPGCMWEKTGLLVFRQKNRKIRSPLC